MLSIVYITRNRCEELKKSILSCESHVSMEHEYVIVDNGSTDDTPQMVETLIKQDMPIGYYLQPENRGVSGGRNIGFDLAKGEICYFIDDDATIISDGMVLDEAYNEMLGHPIIGAMGTDCYDTERKQQLIGCHEKGTVPNTNVRIRGFIGCSHFIRKSAVSNNYLYPSNLMYGSEELYIGLEMYRNGFEVRQFPNLKVLHQPSKSTRESRQTRQKNGHINTYVIKKYFLPAPYSILSRAMFWARIIRFEKGNVKLVAGDIKLSKQRFDAQYKHIMSLSKTQELIRLFGVKNII